MYKNFEITRRKLRLLCLMGILLGLMATVVARLLILCISFFTNLFWFQDFSLIENELVNHQFTPGYLFIPVIGGVLVGIFSGATRAVLTSTIFSLEATGANYGIASLLLRNGAAYLLSIIFMKETIMTEKIARRGIQVPNEYFAK